MSETRTRRRIRKAVESRGFKVENLEWEAPYDAGQGYGGGWTVVVDRPYALYTYPGNEMGGLSVDDALADIDWSLRPTEPCACYPNDRRGRHAALRIKGDPEHPLHEPACRWYIAYHLRWWNS